MKLYHTNSKGEQHMLSFDGKKKGFNTRTAGRIITLSFDDYDERFGCQRIMMRVHGNINLEEMFDDPSDDYKLYDEMLDIRMMKVCLYKEEDGVYLIQTNFSFYQD